MGLAEILFGLAMLLIPIGVAIPLAGSAVTPGEVTAARACFIASAFLLVGIEVGALLFDDKPLLWRVVTGCLVGAAVFVGLPEGLRWISERQKLIPATLGATTPAPLPTKPPAQKSKGPLAKAAAQRRKAASPRVAGKADLPVVVVTKDAVSWARNAGLDHTLKNDSSIFFVGNVFITNTSPDQVLTLTFRLVVSNPKTHLRHTALIGDGRDSLGRTVGVDDLATAKISQFSRVERSNLYILSPVTVRPQSTITGKMVFLAEPFDQQDVNDAAQIAINGDTSYSLEMTDMVTGKTFTMPLPGRYPATR